MSKQDDRLRRNLAAAYEAGRLAVLFDRASGSVRDAGLPRTRRPGDQEARRVAAPGMEGWHH